MKKMLEHALKIVQSRQFWTGVVIFIINGFDAVRDLIPAGIVPYLNSVLGMLAIYFRIDAKQKFDK